MNSFTVFLAFALAAVAVAEPPSGYSYNAPSGGGGGYSGGGGGFSSGGGGFSSGGGGGYTAVSSGGQTSEGLQVDQQLLEQIRQILLKEESQSGGGGNGGFGGGAPSGSYGVPSGSYGVPSTSYGAPGGGRVVGIDLGQVVQAIQVAQYHQQTSQSTGGGGYGRGPATSYSAPSSSYGAPSRPSGSYGAPF